MKKLIVSAVALAAFAAPAMAADLYTPAPEPAVSTWTGFWVGAGVGYGFVNHELDGAFDYEDGEGFIGGAANLSGIGGEGWLGSIGGGYDFQVADRFVLGLFGDYTFSGIDTSASITGGGNIVGGSLDASYKLTAENSWFIGGRAGFLATPDTLLYGLVGYGETDFKAKAAFGLFEDGPPEGEPDFGDSLKYGWTQGGLTWGGGVETKFTENISFKLEYRYIDLDSKTIFDIEEQFGRGGLAADASVDTNIQTVTASVNWRF